MNANDDCYIPFTFTDSVFLPSFTTYIYGEICACVNCVYRLCTPLSEWMRLPVRIQRRHMSSGSRRPTANRSRKLWRNCETLPTRHSHIPPGRDSNRYHLIITKLLRYLLSNLDNSTFCKILQSM